MPDQVPARIEVFAPDGIGEVHEGDDLVALVAAAVPDLADGDVVVLTSKVVSKAEGRTSAGSRDDALAGETVRVVARRGPTSIVVNRLGLVMAAAGVDASNVATGHVVLLPLDPDATAASIRAGLLTTTGRNVAVVVTDTAGRAWRLGQTDLAIGAAGIVVLDDHAGRVDAHGNELAVTAPAIADELAGAADLVKGKLTGRPVAVVRGLGARVLPDGEDGPGARALQRDLDGDMFGLGAREAVVAALAGDQAAAFGSPTAADDLLAAWRRVGLDASSDGAALVVDADDPASSVRAVTVAHAHGWASMPGAPTRFHRATP
ncbi:MAG: putative F420-dependent oxidoreductase [Nocardioidaceae bacterium]|nr:putative F420-dependent oxidoreductase [Nocardioidaceae bacterium]